MIDPRYPVGTFTFNPAATPSTRATGIRAIAEAPALLRMAVIGLDDGQLATPYRPGGWRGLCRRRGAGRASTSG